MIKILAIFAFALILTAPANAANVTKVEIRGGVFDETSNTYNYLEWDAQNFTGFWYTSSSGKTSETLTITGLTNNNRTIEVEKLLYNTSRTDQKYKVFSKAGKKVDNALDYNSTTKTFTKTPSGGYYARLGWFGEVYATVNGKAYKLARIVTDQKSEDKKTLATGKTWELGEGVNLTASSIDAEASPRQAHLILSRDGTKLDDKIVTEGEAYTFVQTRLADESDVPVFVTYVDSIFSGAAGDIVQLRYTWLLSQNVIEIQAGDKFGVFEVKEANENHVLLYNKERTVNLDQNTVQPLYGELKFKVADSSTALRFYPLFEQVIQVETRVELNTVSADAAAAPAATQTAAATQAPAYVKEATPAAVQTSATTLAKAPAENTPVKKLFGFWGFYAALGLITTAYFVLKKKD